MARATKIFDDMSLRAKVKRAQADDVTARLNDGGGLVFIVTKAGKCRALHRYEYQGIWKERWLPGEYPRQLSLAGARNIVATDKELLDTGVDPAESAEGETHALTLAEYARKHFALLACPAQRHLDPDKSPWFADVTRLSGLGKMEIDKIKATDVERALKSYWNGHTPRPSARRICERVAAVLRHRHVKIARNEPVWTNPADWKLLKASLGGHRHYTEHFASLAFEELPAFMIELRKDQAMAARALEWCILTGTRANETAGACWGEIDWKARTWTIPPERLKTERSKGPQGKPFVVPLSLAMVELLRRTAKNRVDFKPSALIFPGPKSRKAYDTSSLWNAVTRINPEITTHGFRSTMVAWGVAISHRKREPFELILMDRVLGHHINPRRDGAAAERLSAALGSYAHHAGRDLYLARRKVVMREWSAFIRAKPAAAPPVVELSPDNANVVPMRRAA
jgi:integrase